jgi:DNA-binding transcriptional MerR regulator
MQTTSWARVGGPPAGLEADVAAVSIGELARSTGLTARTLRFYQSKGLLAPQRESSGRVFTRQDRERLELILQGKRLGFTLTEIREMLAARDRGSAATLPITRRKCVEQIKYLENQRRDLEVALSELRRIYSAMSNTMLAPAAL